MRKAPPSIVERLRFKFFTFLSSVLPHGKLYSVRNMLLRLAGMQIGRNVRIQGSARFFSPFVVIGDNVWVGPYVSFISSGMAEIIIGSNVDIAPYCVLCTGSHEVGEKNHRAGRGYNQDVIVGNGVWLGLRSTLIAGVSVGDGCIVAAGAVVISNTGTNEMWAGIPARKVKDLLDDTG